MFVSTPQDSLETSRNLNIFTHAPFTQDEVNIQGNELFTANLYGHSSFQDDFYDVNDGVDVDPIQYENYDKTPVIPVPLLSSTSLESTDTVFETGDEQVDSHNVAEYELSISATPTDIFSNTYDTSSLITINSYPESYSDWVDSFESDSYKFQLEFASNFELQLNALSANADVELHDISGNILASSKNSGNTDEAIAQRLSPGTYYIRVGADINSSTTYYNLSVSATPFSQETSPIPTSSNTQSTPTASSNPPTSASQAIPQTANNGTRIVRGNLGADTFTYVSGPAITVFLGNGNADYGSGQRDLLDLSSISSTTVTLRLANTTGGGVLYDIGNGTRLFDAIDFRDGKQILFEGIDRLVFADKVENLSVQPNDPLFNQQWNLQSMGVQDAWRFTMGNSNVLIGVQDTGLPVLNGKTNFDLGPTTYIADNYVDEDTSGATSHGLSTQSVINAQINNGVGESGITNSEVYHIDVIGGNTTDFSLVDATQEMIRKANAENRRLVINFSLTGGYSTQLEQLVANNQNVLFVFASGNTGGLTLAEPAILARYNNVIAVGASSGRKDYYGNSKNLGERITYSNWWGSNGGNDLTLTAPSEVIAAIRTQQSTSSASELGFNYNFNGTSASAPHVTGVAALLWSVNKNLTAVQIKDILSQTAYDLGNPGYDIYYGHGFVNASAAVRRALALGMGAA
ncbi:MULTISPECIES: S8 family serine peptidase [Nostocales]|uniref:S8 family serine peptidase n=3 Tax=Nostocales TaxID=1161 RepID=A0A0C1N5X7_9CYAN|nr:S8 family serine peptidase [Tolypothrix bouteillei]KAF3888583.1 S8 family serine peptidase [Tolypothrix bouteillei VB521301]